MKSKKTLLCVLLGLCLGQAALADSWQTVKVNGSQVAKNVVSLSFSGDNVTLTYDDNSTQTVDMSLVSISFDYTTGIDKVQGVEEAKNDGKVYNLKGQLVGDTTDGLRKGVYIVNGKKVLIK